MLPTLITTENLIIAPLSNLLWGLPHPALAPGLPTEAFPRHHPLLWPLLVEATDRAYSEILPSGFNMPYAMAYRSFILLFLHPQASPQGDFILTFSFNSSEVVLKL